MNLWALLVDQRFAVLFSVTVVVGVLLFDRRRRASHAAEIRRRRAKYETALDVLQKHPTDPSVRVAALEAGRQYMWMARPDTHVELPGGGSVCKDRTPSREALIRNEMDARIAGAGNTGPLMTVTKAVVVQRGDHNVANVTQTVEPNDEEVLAAIVRLKPYLPGEAREHLEAVESAVRTGESKDRWKTHLEAAASAATKVGTAVGVFADIYDKLGLPKPWEK